MAISIVRLSENLDTELLATDFSGYATQVLVLATLEANLRVINVCLRLKQPVLSPTSKFTRSMFSTFSITYTNDIQQKLGSARFKQSSSEERAFDRLEDHLYPMSINTTTMTIMYLYGPGTVNDVEGVRTASGMDVEMENIKSVGSGGAIKVVKAWDVVSAKRAGGKVTS
ncbi:hypothetical protein MMC25_001152 [Agyrium rufum]|nr:hypothetical protein [Agyrium rufum]